MNSDLTFGERLGDLRSANGITQEDLGIQVGVKQQTIGNYEKGDAFPSKDVLIRLCDYFKVSLDYLVARTDFDLRSENLEGEYVVYKGKSISIGKLLDLLTSLDTESKLEIYDMINILIAGGRLRLAPTDRGTDKR